MRSAFALVLLLLVSPFPARAQEPPIAPSDTLLEVRLADGSTLYGRVVDVTGERVVVVTEVGARVELARSQIASVRTFRGTLREGEVWPEDDNVSRLFFAPTGRSLPRGRGTFGVFELFLPFLSYGVTDRVTVSGGTPIAPGIIGEVVYLASKVSIVTGGSANLALGVLAFFGTEEPDESVGIVYGAGTFGGPDRSLTVGAGWPFITGDGDDEIADRPLLMAGGDVRLSRHVKLMSENHFFFGEDESGAILSSGVRFFGERLSADFGLGLAIGEDSACCLPIVNFVYSFGK